MRPHFWAACKIWWKSVKNCGRNRPTIDLFTNTQTNGQNWLLVLSNALDRQEYTIEIAWIHGEHSHKHYCARGGLFTGRHIAKTPSETSIVTTVQYDSGTDGIHGAEPSGRAGRWRPWWLVWRVANCRQTNARCPQRDVRQIIYRLYVFCVLYFNYIFQSNLYLKYNLGQTGL